MTQGLDLHPRQYMGPGECMRSGGVLNTRDVCSNVTAILGISVLLLLGGTAAFGQAPASAPLPQDAMTDTAGQNKQLADQITELRAQVAKLQAAVQQTGPGKKKPATKMAAPAKGMGMMDDKGEMGMAPTGGMPSGSAQMAMKDDEGEMGAMSQGGNTPMAPGMSMGDDKDEMGGMPTGSKSTAPAPAMGMCCMGGMASGGKAAMNTMPPAGGMGAMSPSSAMPGQAGASHLYHIGSNGFFLNHPRHITLTPDQKMTFNSMKEKAMLGQASEQRRIDQAEQELYTLTGADQPDTARIQAKIAEIEKLRADQRMNFIRAVADASNVLTPDQRKALLGMMAAAKK